MGILFLLGLINLIHGSLASQGATADITEHFTNSHYHIGIYNYPSLFLGLAIYPNPANQAIYLKSWKEYQQISMFTVDGRWVLTQPVVNQNIDISSLAEGSYRVLLQSLQENGLKVYYKLKNKCYVQNNPLDMGVY